MEGRLTVNKEPYDMSMFELSHNSCYVKEGRARYRDYETDIDARELTKLLLKEVAEENNQFNSEDEFDEKMLDCLTYGINTKEGLIATFYRNLWAMAELREKLKMYEDLEEQGKLIKLPCRIGDILYTNFAVYFGMIYSLVPMMVMPLYSCLQKIDPAVLEAGRDLGASSFQLFWKVIFPLSIPGIMGGLVLVFVPAMFNFYVADALGGGKTIIVGNLISNQFSTAKNWPLGAALSVVIMIFSTLIIVLKNYVTKKSEV